MIIDSLENKKLIADNFIKIAGFEGWNDKALELAFEKTFFVNNQDKIGSKVDKNFIPLIFENGIFSIIDFITLQRCESLKITIENNQEFVNLRTNEKVAFLVFHLLKIDEENKISLQRLNNFYIDLKNFSPSKVALQGFRPINHALQKLYFVADYIWNLCGDNSTDYNFYSKRLILAKVLARSYWFFIKDNSPESRSTQEFIQKQIANIIKFSRFKKTSKEKFVRLKTQFAKIIFDDNLVKNPNPKNFIKKLPFFRLINK